MAQRRAPDARDGLIHCNHCGENYSATYRRCPFCNSSRSKKEHDEYEYDEYEYEDDPSAGQAARGGKRLAAAASPSPQKRDGPSISPFQIISIAVSLVVILTAIWVVATKLVPLIKKGDVETGEPFVSNAAVNPDSTASSAPEVSSTPSALPTQNLPAAPEVSLAPASSPTPNTVPSPEAPATQPTANTQPAPNGPTDFSLNKEDVTLAYQGQQWKPEVTFSPAGTTATLTWESDNPNVVTVSANGTVTAVGRGTTTISAMLPNGATQTCIVRCNWTEESAASPSPSSSSTSQSYSINNPDFTFSRVGELFQLKVTGYTGVVSWSSSNPGVATVSSDGTCTAVANGTCTVTGSLSDGATVQAIVRVNITS